jgi:esterase/lipase superfamily enzyme
MFWMRGATRGKFFLFILLFFSSRFGHTIQPNNLKLLKKVSDSSVSYSEIRSAFVKVAQLESSPTNIKTPKDIVAELQIQDPEYAFRLAADEDYWKLSYILAQGWEIKFKNKEGQNLLVYTLARGHEPNIDLVLRTGGWKILLDEVNSDLLEKAGQKGNGYLEEKLRDWEDPRKREEILLGTPDNFRFEGISRKSALERAAAPKFEPGPAAAPAEGRGIAQEESTDVEVPYATNRQIISVNAPVNTPEGASKYYSYTNSAELSYGVATVNIPKTHEIGEENDLAIWEFTPQPKKHIFIRKLSIFENKETFFADFGKRIAQHESDFGDNPKYRENSKDIIVFIHGFNVDYNHAIKKTAQLMYDMDHAGTPIAFTWPARAVKIPLPGDFQDDVSRGDASVALLENFLHQIRDKFPGRRIHIIAHSLGTRVLSKALINFAKTASAEQLAEGAKKLFGEVILAAPAMDARVFETQWAATLSKVCDKVSLMASDDDMALKVESLAEADDFSFPLGLLSDTVAAIVPGMFNFDLSDLSEGTMSLDHSVYSVVKPAILHIGSLVKKYPVREDQLNPVDRFGFTYMFSSRRQDSITGQVLPNWKFLKF